MTEESSVATNQEPQPGDFIRCPECRRSGTAKMILHPDGDVSLKCDACDAYASGLKLHQSTRVYR